MGLFYLCEIIFLLRLLLCCLFFPCGGGCFIANFLTGKILPINHFLSSATFLRGLDVLNNLRSQIEALYISGKTEYLVTGPQKFLASGIKC